MKLNKHIDHTILKPDATKDQIIKLCKEAIEYNFMSVCVNSSYTKLAYEMLQNSNVLVCTVVGFPLGACTSSTKAYETKQAIKDGAKEIDMVINIGKLIDADYDYVYNDIKEVVDAAENNAIVKVILETCLLNEQQIIKVCELSVKAGAHFVKTSTGFSTGGATESDVKLMKKTVKDSAKVKASGGIRDTIAAIKMINAGADRLGTSASINIINNSNNNNSGY